MPLTGLNRAFVVKGLQVMRQRRRPGKSDQRPVAAGRADERQRRLNDGDAARRARSISYSTR